MRASKLIATACACALLFGGTPSRASDAQVASGPPAAVVETAPYAGGDVSVDAPQLPAATAAGAQQQPRKKGNLFVRVITAPFRGLAKLFGGGETDRKAARVKVEVAPKPETASAKTDKTSAAQTPGAQGAAGAQTTLAAGLQLPASAPTPGAQQQQQPPAPQVVAAPQIVNAPQPVPAGPRRVIANEAAARQQGQQAPAPFVPLIVGVPRDPLSQGRALFEQGYLNEAIAELSIAAVAGPNLVEANNLLGLAHDRRGWHRQARDYYERALSVAPDDPLVLNNLGYSLYLDDRYNDALGKLKRAARLSPAATQIHNNLALVYGRLRKYGDAFKHFSRAGGELYARLQTGALLQLAGRDRDAIRHFEAARRLDPSSAEALRQLITLYNRTGQRDKAEAAQRELDAPKTKSAASTTSG